MLSKYPFTRGVNTLQGTRKSLFAQGLRDGLPIGLGYFAVAFTLGIAAKRAGLTAFQAALATFLTNASAGGYADMKIVGCSRMVRKNTGLIMRKAEGRELVTRKEGYKNKKSPNGNFQKETDIMSV